MRSPISSNDDDHFNHVYNDIGPPSLPPHLICLSCFSLSAAPINKKVYDRLIEGGVDQILATHIAHLFIRDPLVVYDGLVPLSPHSSHQSGSIELDDTTRTDHFENIQSTNWQTVPLTHPLFLVPSLLKVFLPPLYHLADCQGTLETSSTSSQQT